MKLPKFKLNIPQMTKTQLILFIAVVIFLFLDVTAGIILIANKNKSAVRLMSENGQMTRLYALDSAASKGTVSGEYANFKFTKEQ